MKIATLATLAAAFLVSAETVVGTSEPFSFPQTQSVQAVNRLSRATDHLRFGGYPGKTTLIWHLPETASGATLEVIRPDGRVVLRRTVSERAGVIALDTFRYGAGVYIARIHTVSTCAEAKVVLP